MTVTFIQFPTSYQFSALLPHLILFFSSFLLLFPCPVPPCFHFLLYSLIFSFLLFTSLIFLFLSRILISSLLFFSLFFSCKGPCGGVPSRLHAKTIHSMMRNLDEIRPGFDVMHEFSGEYLRFFLPVLFYLSLLAVCYFVPISRSKSWHQTIRYSSTLSFSSSSSSHAAINISIPIFLFFFIF